MPRNALFIEVEPKVLEWAFASSGWSREELIKKLRINLQTFDGWLNKEINPTIRQLEDFAKIVKRPLAVFFLTEPPQEKPLPKDYRMLPEKEGKFDRKTLLAIRMARKLQRLGRELSENLNAKIETKIKNAKLSDNPKEIAENYRREFGFTEDTLSKLKKPKELFDLLRDSIEDSNILVFQTSLPVNDARGFSLVDDNPAVIVVNSKDQIDARLFTLAHELGHIILKESEIGFPEHSLFIRGISEVEKWCNEFASAFLLPEQIAKSEFNLVKDRIIGPKTLNDLSKRYKVSKHMLIYNMYKLGFISKPQYDSVLERYKPLIEVPETKQKKKGGFGQKPDAKCLNEKGQKFVSLVAHNIEKGLITHSEALDYLSIKSKNLDKVFGRAKK